MQAKEGFAEMRGEEVKNKPRSRTFKESFVIIEGRGRPGKPAGPGGEQP